MIDQIINLSVCRVVLQSIRWVTWRLCWRPVRRWHESSAALLVTESSLRSLLYLSRAQLKQHAIDNLFCMIICWIHWHQVMEKSAKSFCRFCLEVDSPKNLIQPCDCRGSCAFVHRTCLSNWLEYADHCNVCKAEYRLTTRMPSLVQLFQAFLMNLNNLTFDMIYLGLFVVTFVPFIYTLIFFGSPSIRVSSLQSHLMVCILITIGLLYMISLIEDCAFKFFNLLRRLSI